MRVLSSVPAALRVVLAGVLLALVAVLTVANPAAAHDELVGSSPAVRADLAEAPAEITLTYSAAIMTEGATVAVFDASGRDWAERAPAIDTNTLTLPVAGLPAAGYVVEWRVVSSDGHPISGTIPFTVGGGAPITSDDVAGAATPEDEGAVVPVVVGAVIAVAVIGITLWIVLSRRRSGAAER